MKRSQLSRPDQLLLRIRDSEMLRRGLVLVGLSCLLGWTGCQTPGRALFDRSDRALVAIHGPLSVDGNRIVDARGAPVSFAGNSFFWSNTGWEGERFYNPSVVEYLVEEWNSNLIRVAMGVEAPGGYLEDPEGNLARIDQVVDAAIRAGVYVIIDWHSHRAETHLAEAIEFFERAARRYGHQPNVIYEIYNEPVDADWGTIKAYAEEVILAIRRIDADNIIVVGTPSWSQDVDVASEDPITGFRNIAYALHFYAGTHGEELRQKARIALDNGIPLMVTEWGTVDADGDGAVAWENTVAWLRFLRENHLSHANWAVNDKTEGASIFRPGTSPDGAITDANLSESGRRVQEIIRDWPVYD